MTSGVTKYTLCSNRPFPYYCKAILRDWIKEENYNFYDHIESNIIDFGNDIMADSVFNQLNWRCIYNNDEWYCYNKSTGSWKNSKRLLYLIIKDIAIDYSIYMYLIKPVPKFEKISSRAFKTEVINELSYVLFDKKVKFDSNLFLLGFDSKVYDLQKGILWSYKPKDYMTMSVDYDIDRKNRDTIK